MCFDNDWELRLKPAPIHPFEGLHTTANEGDQMLILCIASLIEICCATARGKENRRTGSSQIHNRTHPGPLCLQPKIPELYDRYCRAVVNEIEVPNEGAGFTMMSLGIQLSLQPHSKGCAQHEDWFSAHMVVGSPNFVVEQHPMLCVSRSERGGEALASEASMAYSWRTFAVNPWSEDGTKSRPQARQ
jgi:hypothetical protein